MGLLMGLLKIDILIGRWHRYFSTHCRHGDHAACASTVIRRPGQTTTMRKSPAQCKTCAAPCRCSCHRR